MKRKFINVASYSFLMWAFKSIASGVVSAIAVFFTKKKLEKWEENSFKQEEDKNESK